MFSLVARHNAPSSSYSLHAGLVMTGRVVKAGGFTFKAQLWRQLSQGRGHCPGWLHLSERFKHTFMAFCLLRLMIMAWWR